MQHVAYFYDTRGVSLVRQRTGLRRLLVGLFLASSLAWTRSGERAHGTHRAGERVLRFGSRQVVPFFNPASKSDFRNRDQPRAGGQRKTVLVLCPSESDQTFRVFFFSLRGVSRGICTNSARFKAGELHVTESSSSATSCPTHNRGIKAALRRMLELSDVAHVVAQTMRHQDKRPYPLPISRTLASCRGEARCGAGHGEKG